MITINGNIIDVFSKARNMLYAKSEDGAMYISNGCFLKKISQKDFGYLLAQSDRHRRKSPIELVERDMLLKLEKDVKGTFEVSNPYEIEDKQGTACFYTDGKQYFSYDKKYLDIFGGGNNRMFVNDNSSYELLAHQLIIKNESGEFVGLIMPLRISDEICQGLFKALPLKTPWKNRDAQKPSRIAEQLAEAEKQVQRGAEPPSADKKSKNKER